MRLRCTHWLTHGVLLTRVNCRPLQLYQRLLHIIPATRGFSYIRTRLHVHP